MKDIRPYVSLDLETTGLNIEEAEILQIGWVVDDGVSPVESLEKGSVLIRNPKITYGENYAIGMNAWIFQELMKSKSKGEATKYPVVSINRGLFDLMVAIRRAAELAKAWDEAHGLKPNGRVQIAGKNPANFDWPIVLNRLKNLPNDTISQVELEMDAREGAKIVDHRFMDVGAIYFEDFGRNPGLNEINKLINYKEVTHDALEDALNVVVAVRWKMMEEEVPLKEYLENTVGG